MTIASAIANVVRAAFQAADDENKFNSLLVSSTANSAELVLEVETPDGTVLAASIKPVTVIRNNRQARNEGIVEVTVYEAGKGGSLAGFRWYANKSIHSLRSKSLNAVSPAGVAHLRLLSVEETFNLCSALHQVLTGFYSQDLLPYVTSLVGDSVYIDPNVADGVNMILKGAERGVMFSPEQRSFMLNVEETDGAEVEVEVEDEFDDFDEEPEPDQGAPIPPRREEDDEEDDEEEDEEEPRRIEADENAAASEKRAGDAQPKKPVRRSVLSRDPDEEEEEEDDEEVALNVAAIELSSLATTEPDEPVEESAVPRGRPVTMQLPKNLHTVYFGSRPTGHYRPSAILFPADIARAVFRALSLDLDVYGKFQTGADLIEWMEARYSATDGIDHGTILHTATRLWTGEDNYWTLRHAHYVLQRLPVAISCVLVVAQQVGLTLEYCANLTDTDNPLSIYARWIQEYNVDSANAAYLDAKVQHGNQNSWHAKLISLLED